MKKEFNKMIKESIWSTLKENGFTKKGLNFYRQTEETQQILNIQKSNGNSSNHVAFYINCGILINTLTEDHRILTNIINADIRQRIEELSNKTFLNKIILKPATNIHKLSITLNQAIQNDVLSFFNNLSKKEKAIKYMVEHNGLLNNRILLVYLSKHKHKTLILQYIKNIKHLLTESGGAERIPTFLTLFSEIIHNHNYNEPEILDQLKSR